MGFLPINRREMQRLGWEQPDFVYVTGDAYVDHPSFGTAIISRLLEAHGYRVGIISQPDWASGFNIMPALIPAQMTTMPAAMSHGVLFLFTIHPILSFKRFRVLLLLRHCRAL